MRRLIGSRIRPFLFCFCFSALLPPLTNSNLQAQSTVWTGSIRGTILDPSSAVVPHAKILITGKDTGQKVSPLLNDAGNYNSGPLSPGDYLVRVEAEGFRTTELTLAVQVGVVSSANIKLEIGSRAAVLNVDSSAERVNTEQATLYGILTTRQIENLPINGRNFAELAQLEPGVQIQDAGANDMSKFGFAYISFGGKVSRTARMEVDGIDIGDEVAGPVTMNIPLSALQEFQVSQSMLDLTTELTSMGAINMVTRSGTNSFHGQAFYLLRDHNLAAALPGPPAPFQRHQFGGNFGGPLVKDRLLFFAAGERIKQDLFAPVPLESPFQALSGGFNSPYRESSLVGRLDWLTSRNLKFFYRYSYFQNDAVSTMGSVSYQPFKSKNWTRAHVLGADFTARQFMHSLRFGYLKYVNNVTDPVRGSSLPLADLPTSISIGSLNTGPHALAPQSTIQGSHQIKYDGSRILGAHTLRYGINYNRILMGGS